MEKHKIDTWDYQWAYSIFNNNGICINPSKNLITNIGFSTDGTHTFDNNHKFSNQQRFEIDTLKHPNKIVIYAHIINKINKIGYGISQHCYFITKTKQLIKRIIKYLLYFGTSKS
jgi:hypothetical protein